MILYLNILEFKRVLYCANKRRNIQTKLDRFTKTFMNTNKKQNEFVMTTIAFLPSSFARHN